MSVLITQPRQQLKFADGNAFQLRAAAAGRGVFSNHRPPATRLLQMYLKTASSSPVSRCRIRCWSSWTRLGGRASCWQCCSASCGRDWLQYPARRRHQAYSTTLGRQTHGDDAGIDRRELPPVAVEARRLHHTYVNITGHDTGHRSRSPRRLTPHQSVSLSPVAAPLLWPLYGLLAIKCNFLMISESSSAVASATSRSRPEGREL